MISETLTTNVRSFANTYDFVNRDVRKLHELLLMIAYEGMSERGINDVAYRLHSIIEVNPERNVGLEWVKPYIHVTLACLETGILSLATVHLLTQSSSLVVKEEAIKVYSLSESK